VTLKLKSNSLNWVNENLQNHTRFKTVGKPYDSILSEKDHQFLAQFI